MKKTNLLVTIVVAVIASVITAQFMPLRQGMTSSMAKEETAYERVMRTGKIVCGYTPWPPYKEVDPETGELVGIDIEISNLFASLLDVEMEYKEVVLGQDIEDLNSGRVDMMCGTGPWQFTALKYVEYSDATYYAPIYLYGRQDETRFQTKADMNDSAITFSAIDGDLSADLKNRFFPKAKLHSLPQMAQPSQLLLDVALNKADATIYDPQAAKSFDNNNPNQIKKLFPEPLAVYRLSFGVKKGEHDMVNLMNTTVGVMRDVGLVDPILRKYDPEGNFLLSVQQSYVLKN